MFEINRVMVACVLLSVFLLGCGEQSASNAPENECKKQEQVRCQEENVSHLWDMGKPTDRSKNEGF
ncbi:hypothetical protein ACT3TQ_09990 [Halomonas sp. AOP12-C2-37]|uniref:hypothetical protein n=1 Tax=unclassified Halomonas TaxID=2609666 RepID=UPI00403441BC